MIGHYGARPEVSLRALAVARSEALMTEILSSLDTEALATMSPENTAPLAAPAVELVAKTVKLADPQIAHRMKHAYLNAIGCSMPFFPTDQI